MRNILLVAIREIRQVTGTRGFWIMLLAVPVALAISAFASSQLAPERSTAYTIVDKSGRFGPALEQGIEFGYQQQVLRDLATYVERWDLAGVDPQAPWADRQGWLSAAQVARFVEMGGAEAATKRLQPSLPEGAPAFDTEDPLYVSVEPPAAAVTDADGEAFGASLKEVLEDDVETEQGKLPFGVALWIPENYGEPGAVAQMYTNGRSNAEIGRAHV